MIFGPVFLAKTTHRHWAKLCQTIWSRHWSKPPHLAMEGLSASTNLGWHSCRNSRNERFRFTSRIFVNPEMEFMQKHSSISIWLCHTSETVLKFEIHLKTGRLKKKSENIPRNLKSSWVLVGFQAHDVDCNGPCPSPPNLSAQYPLHTGGLSEQRRKHAVGCSSVCVCSFAMHEWWTTGFRLKIESRTCKMKCLASAAELAKQKPGFWASDVYLFAGTSHLQLTDRFLLLARGIGDWRTKSTPQQKGGRRHPENDFGSSHPLEPMSILEIRTFIKGLKAHQIVKPQKVKILAFSLRFHRSCAFYTSEKSISTWKRWVLTKKSAFCSHDSIIIQPPRYRILSQNATPSQRLAFVRGFTLRKNINVYWIYVFMLYIIYVCSMYYTFSWYVYISTWYEYITINIHNIAILWDCMRLPKVLPNLFQNLSISSGLRHWKTWLWPDRSTIQTWCLPRTGWGKPRYWRHLLPLSMVALHAGIRKMEHLPVHMWRLVLLIVKKKQIDAIAA